ncbi:DUF6287 domain-containing protein [Streptococcus suis]|uniref:DUF6287 domain-containing protein n=1 Tax=Streptococcus suis TaxID=1307 RepID=UPI001ABE93A4|nr:hypothetical protein [Streptococcus suis]
MIKKIGLICMFVLLTACQVKQSSTSESTSSSEVASSSSTNSSELVSSSQDYSEYQTVIERYQENIGKPISSLDQSQVSSYLSWLEIYKTVYTGAYYSQYDINHDGIDELLITLEYSNQKVLIDLYTLNSTGEITRLADYFRKSGPEIGEKVTIWPLEDGTLSLESAGSFRIYEMTGDAEGLKQVSESSPTPSSSPAIDLRSLEWNELEASTTTSSEIQSSVDLQVIVQGDYSSLAGTWSNARGNTMIVKADGTITFPDYPGEVEYWQEPSLEAGGYVRLTRFSPNRMTSPGVPFLLVPEGVAIPADRFVDGLTDISDSSKVRLYGSQGLNTPEGVANETYYRQ